MTKEEKKLIDLLKFTINEKANRASEMMNQQNKTDKKHFYHGNYMAFSELYSMIENIERTI